MNPVLAAYLCGGSPAGDIMAPAIFFVLSWVLMTAAMMLPTALPVVAAFGRLESLVERRADAGRLIAMVIGGYILAWLAFGVAAHIAGSIVLALARRSSWLTFNGWAIGFTLLVVAGLFQRDVPLSVEILEAVVAH